MARHSHKHTHNLGDGNDHPVHEPVEHDHEHEDGPTPNASRHHNYTEELVMGPWVAHITPGQWCLAKRDPRDGPPALGEANPAYIYVGRPDGQEVIVARVMAPAYFDGEVDPDDYAQGAVPAGDWEANAKLLAFSPALLRFVSALASPGDGGIITQDWRERATALIEQMNHVEVRSDADRW